MSTKVSIISCKDYSRTLIEECVEKSIDHLGGISQFVSPGNRVLIKPNLCVAESPEKALTTHPEIIRAVVKLCISAGAKVVIGDNPVGDADRSRLKHIWQKTGVEEVLAGLSYERSFLDKNMTEYKCQIAGQDYAYFVSQDVLDMDLVINLPKFKTHVLTMFTGAIKNLYGLLPGNSKKKLHSQLPEVHDFATLLVDIYRLINPGLTLMDAVIGLEGDGPGARGDQREVGLMLAGTDGLAIDTICSVVMGLDSKRIATILKGTELNIGISDQKFIETIGQSLSSSLISNFKLPSTYRFNPDVTERIFTLSRAYVKIDDQKCTACGLCVPNCPASAMEIGNQTVLINQDLCIACLVCHELCPEGAPYAQRSEFYQQLKKLHQRQGQ